MFFWGCFNTTHMLRIFGRNCSSKHRDVKDHLAGHAADDLCCDWRRWWEHMHEAVAVNQFLHITNNWNSMWQWRVCVDLHQLLLLPTCLERRWANWFLTVWTFERPKIKKGPPFQSQQKPHRGISGCHESGRVDSLSHEEIQAFTARDLSPCLVGLWTGDEIFPT